MLQLAVAAEAAVLAQPTLAIFTAILLGLETARDLPDQMLQH
jgi:hypothetical protein